MKVSRRAFVTTAAALPFILAAENCGELPMQEADIDVPVVVSSVNGAAATQDDKDAKASDNVKLYATLQARDEFGHKLYFSHAEKAVIDGKRAQKPLTEGFELPMEEWNSWKNGMINIDWFELRAKSGIYNNAVPGQSKIEYDRKHAGSGWTLVPEDVGTHRYLFEADYSHRKFSSGRRIEITKNGVVKGTHRISIREGDDFPGWMTAMGQLPYIYGSSAEQVEERIGADCADAITWALRRTGREDFPYTYSQGFRSMGKTIFSGYINAAGEFLDRNKNKVHDIGIRRGDLLVYRPPAQHVAVFYSDLRRNGDPIEVVHTYGEKGVVVENLYLGSNFLWRDLLNLTGLQNTRLDSVEVVRLNK